MNIVDYYNGIHIDEKQFHSQMVLTVPVDYGIKYCTKLTKEIPQSTTVLHPILQTGAINDSFHCCGNSSLF
jgi:hypothetical protein